ncbi:Transporter of the ATP-binding cassette (ABC) [Mycoemilia scoparia]|uniref:Transporter of the ATP-binding cassette (ABC) n=1 Tax=Mycoemilia scoparia TaxID=417184 RepID=A0A9W8DIB1_9FUNG|nr:Transporter of the ATP-binding cassette (ABC) [Mycoemilia scoparia]
MPTTDCTCPPLSASSPCADKSSPSYIIKNASPLSRLFSLWFYDFASNIKKDQELDPKDFPLDDEAIEADENLKKEASPAYIKQPFLLSNKLWFFWSIIRPFKWCFAKRITLSVFSTIISLSKPLMIHRLLINIENERDLRVLVPESIENYNCSVANDDSTTKEQNIDKHGSDISLAIRGDADFVWNLPTVDPEKWIVDDVKGTVMLPEPFRKDVDLTKLDTDIIEYCKTTVDLKEIDIEIPLGKLTLIAGPTGSGKTSLIKALMGEMCCLKGQVSFPHYQNHGHDNNGRRWEVGYVSQSPWLQNATIRENVLFGSELDVDRYKRVLYACALNQDIESFPDLDQSLIGERGIVLSGGQKQRLSMARALYSQAPILIFDDCLSAVDAQTAQHLLTYCISPTSELTKGRTVIVISNQTSMCAPMADKAILMKEGRIEAQGTIKELVAKNHIEMDISQDQQADSNNKDSTVADGDKILDSCLDSFKISPIDQEAPDINLPINESLKSEKNIDVYSLSMLQTLYKFSGTSLKSWTTYLIMYILCAGLEILGDMIFTFVPIETIGTTTSGVMTFFALNSLFNLFGNMGQSYSSRIHGKLEDSCKTELQRMIGTRIVNAEPVYFDSTPKKEIFTAFNVRSKCLAHNVISNINQFLRMMSTTTLTGIFLLGSYPLLSVPLALCGVCFYKVQQVFLKFESHADDMEVKHKVGKYRYKSEMSSGLYVIRAFGRQQEFMGNFEKQKKASGRLNECVSLGYKWKDSINSIIYPALNFALTSMFMGLALSDVSGLSILQLLRISQSTVPSGSDYSPSSMNQETILERAIDTGVLGFMLTRIFILTFLLQDIISFGSKIDETAGDIKKFFNYLNLPQEGVNRLLENDKAFDETWPQKGEIVIRDFSTSYDKHVHWLVNLPSKKDKSNMVKDKDQNPDAAPDTVIEKPHNLEPRLILDHISFTIKGGERVGIVGRTGSGKSTLVLSLFNFLKAKSGSIEIDGVDISKIGLEDLRNKMSVITQDPSVFEADVRFNVDPFDDHSDEEILRVLDALELCEMPKPKFKGKLKDDKDANDRVSG